MDSGRRYAGSRWIAVTQPDIDGRYQLAGVPPGEYLVVAAPIGWHPMQEPERLAELEPLARRVELTLDGPATLALVGGD
jgi:hypothetical protein